MWAVRFGAVAGLIALVSAGLPEDSMNAIQLIQNQGYVAESHTVTTKDTNGFILGMQRIPHGKHGTGSSKKPVVLLQHGLGGCSTNWLSNLANESLAYILADAGFDVWLGNSRGNVYSQERVDLEPTDPKFWDFSFEDMAEYDLPAMVDHILSVTGQKQLFYVGHSQGTMIGFAKFSSDPEFAKKIKIFFALAPVSTIKHITSPVRDLAPFTTEIYAASKLFGASSTGSLDWIFKYVTPVCDSQLVDKLLCENVIFYLLGAESPKNLNVTRIPVYIHHNPAGTSMKNVAHFGQLVNSGKFGMFDYGFLGNLQRYHQTSPPQYDITKMLVNTQLYYSKADALADWGDVQGLLPKVQHKHATSINGYSHIDFIYAMSAPKLIYKPIIQAMQHGFGADYEN